MRYEDGWILSYSMPDIILSYCSHHGMLSRPLATSIAFSSFCVLAMLTGSELISDDGGTG